LTRATFFEQLSDLPRLPLLQNILDLWTAQPQARLVIGDAHHALPLFGMVFCLILTWGKNHVCGFRQVGLLSFFPLFFFSVLFEAGFLLFVYILNHYLTAKKFKKPSHSSLNAKYILVVKYHYS
jgi:hypothetical protein